LAEEKAEEDKKNWENMKKDLEASLTESKTNCQNLETQILQLAEDHEKVLLKLTGQHLSEIEELRAEQESQLTKLK
jgi:predicted  nucleic acid-binding Zn-ribbon protein